MVDSLPGSVAVFIGAAAVITLCGIRLANCADRLADKTGWGEALMGGLFLAGVTSVPDFAATLTAAADGYAELAMGNILGSMAVNLAFLAVGDLTYRRANLEHAAASSGNLIQAGLFIVLLTIPLLAMLTPTFAVLGVHPATPVLLVAYLFGYHLVRRDLDTPMWQPRRTAQTVVDEPDERRSRGQTLVWPVVPVRLDGVAYRCGRLAADELGGNPGRKDAAVPDPRRYTAHRRVHVAA